MDLLKSRRFVKQTEVAFGSRPASIFAGLAFASTQLVAGKRLACCRRRSGESRSRRRCGALGAVGQAVAARKLAEGAVLTGAGAAAGQESGRTEKQIKDLAKRVIKEIAETPDDVLKPVKENPVTSIIEGALWIPSIIVDAKLRKYFNK